MRFSFILLTGISFLILSEGFSPTCVPTKQIIQTSPIFSQANVENETSLKEQVLELLSTTPNNAPTSKKLTTTILNKVAELEKTCPTPEEDVLVKLGGNWELIWTAQDTRNRRSFLLSYINPLENQSYSNNPDGASQGRANPFLPRWVQDRLERLGIIQRVDSSTRSTQVVLLEKRQVRNVVAFQIPGLGPNSKPRRGSLTVDIRFQPNPRDRRRIDVKFDACQLTIPQSRVKIKFPLGLFGPTGWLRTGYIDDTLRITRGHKGSVFVLARTPQPPPSDS